MANRYRGETSAVFDGRRYTLCLTLGALAELERAFEVMDMTALVERFSRDTLSAGDAILIIGAGLRGGGNAVEDHEVARMTTEGGAPGFARVVTELLAATFGAEEAAPHPL